MTEWKNLKAIEKDLFCAQGHISIDIGRPVASDERPPLPDYVEETEEEFYKCYTTDVDFSAGPELGLIKDMLSMVEVSDIVDEDEDEEQKENTVVHKTNLNPVIPDHNEPKPVNKKRCRNAAMASLLQAIGEEKKDAAVLNKAENVTISNSVVAKQSINGVKPNGVIKNCNIKGKVNIKRDGNVEKRSKANLSMKIASKSINDAPQQCGDLTSNSIAKLESEVSGNNSESISKVNSWLSAQCNHAVAVNPVNMFKKKNAARSDKLSVSPHSQTTSESSYKPSVLANEYYLKYVERSKLKEQTEMNIWTKAEQQMKEIDARMKLEADKIAKKASSTPPSSAAPQDNEFDEVFGAHAYKLPFNRHIWSDDCIVCEMMAKHKHDVNSMKDRPELQDPPSYLNEKMEIS